MIPNSTFKTRTPLRRAGKKGNAWKTTRRQLKKESAAMGITRCELNYPNCTGDDQLGFAHGRKRTRLKGNELHDLCCLICNNCHSRIEFSGPEAMLAVVESVISERDIRI